MAATCLRKHWALNLLCAFAMAVLLAACGEGSPDDLGGYLAWVNDDDNGLVSAHEAGSNSYTLKYLPTAYLMARDSDGTGLSMHDSAQMRARYDSCRYFLLTIRNRTASSSISETALDSSTAQALQQLSLTNDLRNTFTARCGARSISPIAAWMETSSGFGAAQRAMVAFSRRDVAGWDSIEVIFDGRSMGGGEQHFRFLTRDIERTPQI